MARDETAGIAALYIPAWAGVPAFTKISRIPPEPGDHGKGVTAARVNRNPASAPPLAVTHEIARGQRRAERARAVQREGDAARAIVTAVHK